MGELRNRMERDLEIRGYAAKTRATYLYHVRLYVMYHRKSPDRLGVEDVYRYQHHLIREHKVSYSYFNQAVQALRFFYGVTLKVAWDIKMLPFHKQHRSIPVVLSTSETAALLAALVNPKHRALLMTVYSSGLRLNEVRQLQLDDLDAGRMVIHVRAGKGGKERYVVSFRQACVTF
jgi:site-specific recombinase XerD